MNYRAHCLAVAFVIACSAPALPTSAQRAAPAELRAEAWMTPLVLDTGEAGVLEVSVRATGGHSVEATQAGAGVRLRKLPKGCRIGGVKGAKLGWKLAEDAGAAVVHLPIRSKKKCVGRMAGTVVLSLCQGSKGSASECRRHAVEFEGVARIGDAPPASVHPAPGRIVAIGDLHGDLEATLKSLRLAGLIDSQSVWTGGATWLVQTGDQTDRGDDEREIIEFLERLRLQALAAGGRVIVLNGNHETMQVLGDMRYVTPGGLDDFPAPPASVPRKAVPAEAAPRATAFAPGGPWARLLSTRNLAVKVGDTVFVHGGVTPKWATVGLEGFNAPTRAWMAGKAPAPDAVQDPDGPLWSRHFSSEPDASDCAQLEDALEALGARRMVVGHTVQEGGISAACDNQVWRIDVGMSAHYGGKPAALEIVGDKVRVLE